MTIEEQVLSHLPQYAPVLRDILMGKGFPREQIQDSLWRMLDRGQIHLDRERRLAAGPIYEKEIQRVLDGD